MAETKKYAGLEAMQAFKDNFDAKFDEIDESINGIGSVYETKDASDAKLDEAKSYTDSAVSGLASTSSVATNISTHNTSTSAHNDIRGLITDLTTKLNNFLDVDDTTSDQLSEVLTLIENNKGTLESLTTSKVNVSDIVNNLTTNSSSKVLSAAQGVAIKSLIDALQSELNELAEGIAVDYELDFESFNPIANSAVTLKFDEVDERLDNFETHEHTADKILMCDAEGNYFESEVDAAVPAGTLLEAFEWIDGHLVNLYANLDGSGVDVDDAISEHNSSTTAHSDIRTSIGSAISEHNSSTTAHSDIRTSIGGAISEHNSSITAHSDIRASIDELEDSLENKANSTHTHTVSDITDIDNYEFITVEDIDTICNNTTIQVATLSNEVMF